jgi:hypothetical protein
LTRPDSFSTIVGQTYSLRVAKVHDTLRVQSADGLQVFVVERVRLNEASIVVLIFGLFLWLAHYALSGYLLNAAYTVLGLLGVIAARRAFRIRVEVLSDRIVVVNYWRTFSFAWADVLEVGIGSLTQGPLLQPAVSFRLRDGRVISAQATPRNPDHLQTMLRELSSSAPSSVAWPNEHN